MDRNASIRQRRPCWLRAASVRSPERTPGRASLASWPTRSCVVLLARLCLRRRGQRHHVRHSSRIVLVDGPDMKAVRTAVVVDEGIPARDTEMAPGMPAADRAVLNGHGESTLSPSGNSDHRDIPAVGWGERPPDDEGGSAWISPGSSAQLARPSCGRDSMTIGMPKRGRSVMRGHGSTTVPGASRSR